MRSSGRGGRSGGVSGGGRTNVGRSAPAGRSAPTPRQATPRARAPVGGGFATGGRRNTRHFGVGMGGRRNLNRFGHRGRRRRGNNGLAAAAILLIVLVIVMSTFGLGTIAWHIPFIIFVVGGVVIGGAFIINNSIARKREQAEMEHEQTMAILNTDLSAAPSEADDLAQQYED